MTPSRTLLALLLAAGACGDPSGPGDGPASEYDLVFEGTDAAGRPVLVRADPRGAATASIAGGVEGIQPRVSPDGSAIVYVAPGHGWTASELRILRVGASAPEWFGSAQGALEREVSWSPDGRQVAFMSSEHDALGDIVVAEVAGARLTNLRNLTPNPDPDETFAPERTPAWSPDGRWIAFSTYRSGNPAIWVMRSDGSAARQLTATGDHGDFLPSWSPEGRYLAFQRTDASGARVGIVDLATGTTRMLPLTGAHAPAWHPSGDVIAVSATIEGEADIVLVSADDGHVTARVRRSGPDRHPAWIRSDRGPR